MVNRRHFTQLLLGSTAAVSSSLPAAGIRSALEVSTVVGGFCGAMPHAETFEQLCGLALTAQGSDGQRFPVRVCSVEQAKQGDHFFVRFQAMNQELASEQIYQLQYGQETFALFISPVYGHPELGEAIINTKVYV
ncbi:MAG: hypothetical protein MI750_14960 [Xanthomonadales bacterium]|jgi:hypothetical protein|nr:hypothetical protein [Xanthomonadales bacterium]